MRDVCVCCLPLNWIDLKNRLADDSPELSAWMFQNFGCSTASALVCRDSGAWQRAQATPEQKRYVSGMGARAARVLVTAAMRTTSSFMCGLQTPSTCPAGSSHTLASP